MIAPALLLAASIAAVLAARFVPGWSDAQLPAAAAALAALVLVLRAAINRHWTRALKAQDWVLLDGSNVMYWRDGEPRVNTLRDVIQHLTRLDHSVAVVFDANAGYLVAGQYLHDQAFARLLGLPVSRVMVVPKGTPADPFLLDAAADLGARIVTNDRYRDWIESYPELRRPGALIPGGYRAGKLWLKFPEA